MTDMHLTERQRNELEFYEQYSQRAASLEVCFDPIAGMETRPWNSYWRVIELVKENFGSGEQRLLDFGCGTGESSVVFAKIGYEVFGFDLSPSNISLARRRAEEYDLAERTHFAVSVAERLEYPDEHFDVVVGFDILHHINIEQALAECSRVLKPGGLAIFHEPMRVPLLDALRETRLLRWLVPKEASLDRHITEDERKLTPDDLAAIRRVIPDLSAERFLLFSRLDRFIRDPERKDSSLLEKVDHLLFGSLPFLKAFGGVSVLMLRKPK